MDSTSPHTPPSSTPRPPETGAPFPNTEGSGSHSMSRELVGDVPTDEINVLQLVNVILRRWHVVVGFPLVAGFLVAAYSLTLPPMFTATATFVAETGSRSVQSSLADLASQFGLTSASGQSPRFYAVLAKSRKIMEQILLARYADPREGEDTRDSATLLEILDLQSDIPAAHLALGVKTLGHLVSVEVDNQTSTVELRVEAAYPTLAAAVANRFVKFLNDFNARTRQSRAGERRKFIEERVGDAELELGEVEEQLKTFYERNRTWEQSPNLVFEEGQLHRLVQIQQEVYLTLKREYETARIEEVNSRSVITVIDAAVSPQVRSKPRRRLLVMLAVLLGGLLGVGWAFGIQYASNIRREESQEYREFTGLLQRVRDQLRQIPRSSRKPKRVSDPEAHG